MKKSVIYRVLLTVILAPLASGLMFGSWYVITNSVKADVNKSIDSKIRVVTKTYDKKLDDIQKKTNENGKKIDRVIFLLIPSQ